MKTNLICTACILTVSVISSTANAALIDRGSGLIYDTHLNITWLADANYGAGSVYDNGLSTFDGRMTWQNAMNWAANLSYYDSVRGVTYDDWRLPTTLQPDPSCSGQYTVGVVAVSHGYNCTGSEMGHLFYTELGGQEGQSIAVTHNDNYNLFIITQFDSYWSSTEYAPNIETAWAFALDHGIQGTGGGKIDSYNSAWAVRDGDVAAVPVPAALWLFCSGLIGLIGLAKRNAYV